MPASDSTAEHSLTQRIHVRIVLDDDRQIDSRGNLPSQMNLIPPKIHRLANDSSIAVDDSRRSDANTFDRSRRFVQQGANLAGNSITDRDKSLVGAGRNLPRAQ